MSTSEATMGRAIRWAIAAVGIIALLGLGVGFWRAVYAPDDTALPTLAELELGEIDERVSLRSQHDRPFDLEELHGKVWVADFIFTRCAGPCPRMTLGMRHLQDMLEEERNLRLVSFTVDPDYDTPEVLADYAEGYEADPDRWVFLTGEASEMRRLAKQSFLLGTETSRSDDGGIMHSVYFVLVDRKGRIRGYYDGIEEVSRQRLARDIRRLLREDA